MAVPKWMRTLIKKRLAQKKPLTAKEVRVIKALAPKLVPKHIGTAVKPRVTADLRKEAIIAEVREQTIDILRSRPIPPALAAKPIAKAVVAKHKVAIEAGEPVVTAPKEEKKGGILPLLAAAAGIALMAAGGG